MKSAATQAGFYGVTKDGCADPIQKGAGFEVYRTIAGTENRIYSNDINRRRKLKEAVENQGFDQVIEETAYTWFNRLIAIRFMEVNGYIPTRTRVLSSETGSNTPDLVAQYMDVDLGMSDEEIEKVARSIRDNRYDDAFALLFIKQCNALNELLPKLFEKTDDYMELLLKLSYTSDGVVRMLVDSIPESNFNVEEEGQVEIIGWLYQYYNTELKDDTFAKLKKNVKVTKERIPSATQLFTPDWIVCYMVENSLGKMWTIGHSNSHLENSWTYYLKEVQQDSAVDSLIRKVSDYYSGLNPENIKIMDPCMGSGHILVYAFDLLVQIYESEGYATRDIPQMIIENNLYGIDIDARAAQLAYFAVMMKACQYNKRFLRKKIQPRIYVIPESNAINKNHRQFLGIGMEDTEKRKANAQLDMLLQYFVDAQEYGSMLQIEALDWDLLTRFISCSEEVGQVTLDAVGLDETKNQLLYLIEVAKALCQKYEVVCTNPPYMGYSSMSTKLSQYIKKHYGEAKADLFAVFIKKCLQMTKPQGYTSMITMQSWMFLSSFEQLRTSILNETVSSLVQIGYNSFPEMNSKVAQAVAFVIQKGNIKEYKGVYVDLNSGYAQNYDKAQAFIEVLNRNSFYTISQDKYETIPGKPIAYWASSSIIEAFETQKRIGDFSKVSEGIKTGDNERFLRLWFEVIGEDFSMAKANSGYKWYPHHKGGEYQKWYGNLDYVINWEFDGKEIKASSNSGLQGQPMYFKKVCGSTKVSSKPTTMRLYRQNVLFDSGAPSIMADDMTEYIMALINSKVGEYILQLINPTLGLQVGDIKKIPVIKVDKERIDNLVAKCVDITKEDWDSFETSWDFSSHPLVAIAQSNSRQNVTIEKCFEIWTRACDERFDSIKDYEEEINQIFIASYRMENQLTERIDDANVTIHRADLQRDIKSLISYAVGCMFGRYSLSENGIIYAGGKWSPEKYGNFIPDDDNCIPISDEAYFADDIVGRFCEFLKVAFGEKTLNQNLDYIAYALGNKGNASIEIIRNYFLNDFYKDHCVTYSVTGSGKRPIYWLFDSGKQNGFKCLIYMHRYEKDTVGRIRSDYLRKAQEAIEGSLKNAEYTIANSSSAVDKAMATKKREKYIKQLNETRAYFQALSHVALKRIEIDLDDGVKTNYAKFQGIEVVDENGKKQKIDLLAKI